MMINEKVFLVNRIRSENSLLTLNKLLLSQKSPKSCPKGSVLHSFITCNHVTFEILHVHY